jgi:hypothetical protein
MPLVAAHRLDWNPRRRMVAEASTLRALPGDREEGPSQRPLQRKRGRHLCPESEFGDGLATSTARGRSGRGARETSETRRSAANFMPAMAVAVLCLSWTPLLVFSESPSYDVWPLLPFTDHDARECPSTDRDQFLKTY